jgi:MinD-like ATPase involved in chromosome partitioning or flagellar assembly
MVDDETPEEETRRQRRRAEGTAGDLARMGIDPRSLGLGEPEAPPASARPAPSMPDDGSVVPLRPEFARQAEPAPPAPSASIPTFASARPVPVADVPVDDPVPRRPAGAVEQLLARTSARLPVPRSAGRLARGVAKGLATPDAAAAVQQDRELVDAVRTRQTDRRVVAFVAGKGGVGCTSVAVGVGATFAALREDRSVVVDMQRGTPSLGLLHGADAPRSVLSLLAADHAVTPPASPAGLGLVDGAGWDTELRRRDVAGVLDRLGADHAFHLLDAGDEAGDGGHAALARADQVVAVTTSGGHGLAALELVLDRVARVNPSAADVTVHVVVCPTDAAYAVAHREVVSRLGHVPARLVIVPPDPHLGAGLAYDASAVAASTRAAMLQVAAAVALGVGRR